MALLNKKVSAFTLLETLVSLVIIVLCFGLAGMLITQIESSDNKYLRFRAHLEINRELIHTIKNKTFFDKTTVFTGFFIEKSINKIQGKNNSVIINIAAIEKNKKTILEERKNIIWTLEE